MSKEEKKIKKAYQLLWELDQLLGITKRHQEDREWQLREKNKGAKCLYPNAGGK